MPLPLPQFFPHFKKYHSVYTMRRTYAETCGFLAGYETGTDLSFLKGFHSWLAQRRKGRPELYWPLLVLCEIYDDGELPDFRSFREEEDEQAVAVLFSLLDQYFETLPGSDLEAGS